MTYVRTVRRIINNHVHTHWLDNLANEDNEALLVISNSPQSNTSYHLEKQTTTNKLIAQSKEVLAFISFFVNASHRLLLDWKSFLKEFL